MNKYFPLFGCEVCDRIAVTFFVYHPSLRSLTDPQLISLCASCGEAFRWGNVSGRILKQYSADELELEGDDCIIYP